MPPKQNILQGVEVHPQDGRYWNELARKLKTVGVERNIRTFIANMKKSIVRQIVPAPAFNTLESRLYHEEDLELGWSSERTDVQLVEMVMAIFNLTAIYLSSTRTVLPYLEMGYFPLLYVGILTLSGLYRLNTQVIIQNKILLHKNAIRSSYLSWQIFVDAAIIALCLFEYTKIEMGYVRLLVLLKLSDLKQHVVDDHSIAIHRGRSKQLLWGLLNILGFNMLIAHVMALVVIAMVDDKSKPNWMNAVSVSRGDPNWPACYIWAFYWCTTIMLTIGFGDLTPKTPKQAIIIAFVELLSVLMLAYCINAAGSLMATLREMELTKQQNLITVNRFMHYNEVPPNVRSEVKNAVANLSDNIRASEVQQENAIIESIEPQIRQKLLLSTNYRPLLKMSLFNRMSTSTIQKIAVALERRLYYNSETLILRERIPDRLFMLKEGCLYEASVPNSKQVCYKFGQYTSKNSQTDKKLVWVLANQTIKQRPADQRSVDRTIYNAQHSTRQST